MERRYGIDLIKALAIVGVIAIHTSAAGLTGAPEGAGWLAALWWGTLARPAVPLFFLCSGNLLLRPEKPLPLKKLFFHNMLRIAAAMFFWAMAYQCYHLLASGTLSVQSLLHACGEVLLFRQEFHLYYLQILLLVYLLLPVTRVLARPEHGRERKYALVVWCLLGIVYPTVGQFWPFTLLSGIPLQWKLNMTYAAAGYGLLGFDLWVDPPKSSRWFPAALCCGFILVFFGTWFLSLRQGSLYQGLLEGMTVGVALMAYGVFGLCAGLRKPDGFFGSAVEKLSRGAFCIYLVHAFFLPVLTPLVTWFPRLLSIPLLTLANLLLSLGVYEVLRRVPVVCRWLI